MAGPSFALGERVLATVGGTGSPRAGTVTAVLDSPASRHVWGGAVQSMILFDGDKGNSGPCHVLTAEGELEHAALLA